LEDKERAGQAAERERKALLRDQANGAPVDEARITELAGIIADAGTQAEAIRAGWTRELEAAHALVDARATLAEAKKDLPDGGEPPAELVTALTEARAAFEAARWGDGLVSIEVTPDVVARVVSDWTGIPLGKVAREQAVMVADLEHRLTERIKGQDAAIAAVSQAIKASKAGLRAPEQPVGVFLLVGPSGVGKTETGLTLADMLFGDEKSVVTINMSEFQEKHTVSRLIGSPPGYVGYGEGGMLTEAVRQRPYSVVLLDEVEKAHLDVLNLFYQVFDKGMLADGEGKEISFRNTVIMLTSNLASDVIQEMTKDGADVDL